LQFNDRMLRTSSSLHFVADVATLHMCSSSNSSRVGH